MAHTISELQTRQALPLDLKVKMTKTRIREWIRYYGVNDVAVAFSGGKDSTVLLHMVRQDYPQVEAMFCDTGLEYPEIRDFVKTFDNVTWVKPRMNFRQVIEKYGYPFISKEVAETVSGAKKYLTRLAEENEGLMGGQKPHYKYRYDRIMGQGKYAKNQIIPSADQEALKNLTGGGTIGSIEKSEELENLLNKDFKTRNGQVYRTARLLGMLTRDNQIKATAPSKDYSAFSCEKYKFLLDAPFEISNQCCNVMKKQPSHDYIKKTGKAIITAQMASESRLRTQAWLKHGCNGFDLKNPTSNPMAFWTEQDVLLYIKLNDLPICSVYGEVVKDYDETDNVDGQMDMSELDASFGIFDLGAPLLKTTGCKRTGCMFCGFGCHLEKEADSRFLRMKETHPKQYEWIMKPWDEGGLGFKDVIDWLNEHGDLNIRY